MQLTEHVIYIQCYLYVLHIYNIISVFQPNYLSCACFNTETCLDGFQNTVLLLQRETQRTSLLDHAFDQHDNEDFALLIKESDHH